MVKEKCRSNTTSSGAQVDAHHDSQPIFKKERIDPPSFSSNSDTNNHSVAHDRLQGMPSSSSISDITNKIILAVNEIYLEDVDVDVDRLIDYKIDLLEHDSLDNMKNVLDIHSSV